MQVEVGVALNFIASNLYNKLPRRRVDAFAEELEKSVAAKIKAHWYPDNPNKGAAYRCLNVTGEKVDPVIIYSAINSGLDIEEVSSCLPTDLTLWIDPGEVSFSVTGEKGEVRILYSERRSGEDAYPTVSVSQPAVTTAATAVTTDDFMGNNLSSSLGSLSLSSASSSSSWGATSPIPWSAPNGNPWNPVPINKGWSSIPAASLHQMTGFQPVLPVRQNNSNRTMPAAMFAQTKFGSTKLKSNGKRSNKLTPPETFTARSIQPPQSLFPMASDCHMSGNVADNMYPQNMFNDSVYLNNNLSLSHKLFGQMNGQYDKLDGRLSPNNDLLSNVSSPPSDHDWVDLTDMNVSYPFGNHLLAT